MNADSLFEAAVLALQAFKASGWTEGIGPATQVEVEVRVTTTRHVVERGADPTVDGRGVGQSCGAAEAGSAEGSVAGGSPGVVRLGTNIRRLSSRDLPLPKFVRAGSQREHRCPCRVDGWLGVAQTVRASQLPACSSDSSPSTRSCSSRRRGSARLRASPQSLRGRERRPLRRSPSRAPRRGPRTAAGWALRESRSAACASVPVAELKSMRCSPEEQDGAPHGQSIDRRRNRRRARRAPDRRYRGIEGAELGLLLLLWSGIALALVWVGV